MYSPIGENSSMTFLKSLVEVRTTPISWFNLSLGKGKSNEGTRSSPRGDNCEIGLMN